MESTYTPSAEEQAMSIRMTALHHAMTMFGEYERLVDLWSARCIDQRRESVAHRLCGSHGSLNPARRRRQTRLAL